MGNLLALLRGSTDATGDSLPPAIPVNFDDPAIASCEEEICKKLFGLVSAGKDRVMPPIKSYTGCEELIRNAIASASQETEDAAWESLVPCVSSLHACYEYAIEIEGVLSAIFDTACSSPSGGAQAGLLANQATAKAFVIIASLGYEFDEIKISTPNIQNDFSYYRRTINRRKTSSVPAAGSAGGRQKQQSSPIPVSEDVANRMSLFYASPTPFLKMLIDGTTSYCKRNPGQPATLVASYLLLLATICLHTASAPADEDGADQSSRPLTTEDALRGMTVLLILYDHVHPSGLFLRPHTVNLRAHVKAIQTVGGSNSSSFVNALKYSTKHFSSPDVPKSVKLLLEPSPSVAQT